MGFQTFSWPILTETSGKFQPSLLEIQFGDGYQAQAINGPRLQALRSAWPVRVLGTHAYCMKVHDFFEANMAKRFIWNEPTGRRILVRASEWELVPSGGGVWSVAATFNFAGVAPNEGAP